MNRTACADEHIRIVDPGGSAKASRPGGATSAHRVFATAAPSSSRRRRIAVVHPSALVADMIEPGDRLDHCVLLPGVASTRRIKGRNLVVSQIGSDLSSLSLLLPSERQSVSPLSINRCCISTINKAGGTKKVFGCVRWWSRRWNRMGPIEAEGVRNDV
jgi:hypothetical protein